MALLWSHSLSPSWGLIFSMGHELRDLNFGPILLPSQSPHRVEKGPRRNGIWGCRVGSDVAGPVTVTIMAADLTPLPRSAGKLWELQHEIEVRGQAPG